MVWRKVGTGAFRGASGTYRRGKTICVSASGHCAGQSGRSPGRRNQVPGSSPRTRAPHPQPRPYSLHAGSGLGGAGARSRWQDILRPSEPFLWTPPGLRPCLGHLLSALGIRLLSGTPLHPPPQKRRAHPAQERPPQPVARTLTGLWVRLGRAWESRASGLQMFWAAALLPSKAKRRSRQQREPAACRSRSGCHLVTWRTWWLSPRRWDTLETQSLR